MAMLKKLFLIVLVVTMLFSFSGCTGQQAEQETGTSETEVTKPAGENLVFGWSQRSLSGTPWYEAMVQSAKDTAQENGIELIVLDAQNKPDKQVSDIEDLISQNVDVIIIDAVDPQAVLMGVRAANSAGIPVVLVDSAMDTSEIEVVSFVTSDNYKIGYGVGYELGKIWNKPDANIVVMSGHPGDAEGFLRRTGFISGFSEYQYEKYGATNMNVLAHRYAGDWDGERAMSQMQDILVKFPDQIDIFFCEGDAMSLGALQAMKAANQNIIIGSIDGQREGLEAIMAGDFAAIGLNSAVQIGKTGIEFAIKYLNGENVPAKYFVESPTITQVNVNEFYDPDMPFL